jgi:hypothetical protein
MHISVFVLSSSTSAHTNSWATFLHGSSAAQPFFYPEAGDRNLQRNVAALSQITVKDILFCSDDEKSRFL